MKVLRFLILLTLIAPIMGVAMEACCAPTEEHAAEARPDTCGPQAHFEAQSSDCCHEDHCAQCATCNLPAFSPTFVQTSSTDFSTPHRNRFNQNTFAEVVSAVLTPPPTR